MASSSQAKTDQVRVMAAVGLLISHKLHAMKFPMTKTALEEVRDIQCFLRERADIDSWAKGEGF